MSAKTRAFIWIILILVVILLIFVFFGNGVPEQPADVSNEEVTEITPGQDLKKAEEGKFVSDFPMEFILEDGVVADDSYSISYAGTNTNQPVATYTSRLSMEENVNLYEEFLRQNEWNITQEADASEEVTFFYARKAGTDANITFQDRGEDGVKVTIALAMKQSAESSQ